MAQAKQKNIALNGMDLSIDEGHLPENMARFIKGWTYFLNNNSNVGGRDVDGGLQEGANQFVYTPLESNVPFCSEVVLPTGINRHIGGGFVKETGKYYSCLCNSANNHSIWELDGNNGACKKVMENSCLGFRYEPEYFINSDTRFTYSLVTYTDKSTNLTKTKTWIFITDYNSNPKQIMTDDAISTNGFKHSFFSSDDDCCGVCSIISMGVPRPTDCIVITPVDRTAGLDLNDEAAVLAEKAKPNSLNFKVWQWRVRAIDCWGRESEHGDISAQYYNSTNNTCANNEDLYSRCVDITFEKECPHIVCYDIEFRNCSTGNNELNGDSDWKRYDRICLYDECDTSGNYQPDFWKRNIKSAYLQAISDTNGVSYNPATKKITYRFCGNKDSAILPKVETDRIQNYIPQKANSIFKLENKIGTANNIRGFDPLVCDQLDAVKFGVNVLSEGSTCNPFARRKIKVRGYYYNPIDGVTTNVRLTLNNSNVPYISYGRAGNHGILPSPSTNDDNAHYDQYFKIVGSNGVDNLVAYLVGMEDLYSVGVQYKGTQIVGPMTEISDDQSIFTQWEFDDIPAGIYVLRFGAAKAGVSTGYRDTSANFKGMTPVSNVGQLLQEQHEIVIDVRNGDYDSMALAIPQAAMIWDLTSYVSSTVGTGNIANAVTGYVVATNTTGIPTRVEKAIVSPDINTTFLHSVTRTDHNGYYFATVKGTNSGIGAQLQLNISIASCPGASADTSISTGGNEYIHQSSLIISNYLGSFKIKGKIIECTDSGTPNAGKGIANVSVIYTNGRHAITDILGYYEIDAHGVEDRVDSIIISNGNSSCIKVQCDGCTPSFAPIPVTVPSCGTLREVTIPTLQMKFLENTSTRGLMIGKYGCGIVLKGDCIGSETFVQANDKAYVEIVDMDNVSRITYDLTGLVVPAKFKSLSFYVTENLTYDDWEEWNVDYAILEDNNGVFKDPTNPSLTSSSDVTNPARVRIYLESLLYYTAYSSANTSWQFIPGDLIQIFELSDGTKVNIQKIVSYTEGENYITIDYDASMKDFAGKDKGAKVRFLRPKTFKENELFYQVCGRIKLVNGQIPAGTSPTGILTYSNVFKLQRSIPIYINNPVLSANVIENVWDVSGKIVGSRTTTKWISIPSNSHVSRTNVYNHHSPSDFFGSHCWGRGRVSVKNRYEKEHHLRTEISISKGISPEGNTNYLHQFYESDSYIVNEQQYASITGVVCRNSILLAICPADNFTLMFDQNEFKNDAKTGQIFAIPSPHRLGKPRSKIGGDFGCQQFDLNTISYRNGMVWYLDGQTGVVVKHNFNEAIDFTPSGLKGWLNEKISYHAQWNSVPHESGGKKYFHSIVDPIRDEFILGSAELNQSSTDYVNQERGIMLSKNETVAIDINKPLLKYFLHFTPEMFGVLETAMMGGQLLSFNFGKAWMHYPNLPNATYNNFYGIQCKKIYEPIFNLDMTSQKAFLYLEIYCKQYVLYVDRIITEAGQESRIMPNWFERNDNFWMADFKCQTNSQADPNLPTQTGIKAILDGEGLHGRWAKVRLVSKDADDSKYCELTAIVCCMAAIEKAR